MTEEVIARRKNVGWRYILLIVLGVILIILSAIFIKGYSKFIYIAVSVAVIVFGTVIHIKFKRTPLVIITRRDDELICPNKTFKISEVTNVIARRAHYKGIDYSWGRIVITVNGTDIIYNYVENVEAVQRRITELMLANKNS
ncbi:MAG: hypothetical protein ACI4QI_03610 [Candidatus Coproplasma sp.]